MNIDLKSYLEKHCENVTQDLEWFETKLPPNDVLVHLSNHNHGNSKKHPFGKHGEHAHDYIYDNDGNLISREPRDLSPEERKENDDIL